MFKSVHNTDCLRYHECACNKIYIYNLYRVKKYEKSAHVSHTETD